MMIDERVLLLPISAVNALKKVRRACEVCVNVDHSLLEDVFSVMMGNCQGNIVRETNDATTPR